MKNPNRAGCNVVETIWVLKFPQVQGSLQLARKVALEQVAYENETRGLKNLKILGFSRCNEGTIGDRAVNNPNSTGCTLLKIWCWHNTFRGVNKPFKYNTPRVLWEGVG